MTQAYTIYEYQTGEIIRSGKSQISVIEDQRQPGEVLAFGEYDAETHFFHEGQPAARPRLPDVELIAGQGWAFTGDLPVGGVEISFSAPFYDPITTTDQTGYLSVPIETLVTVTPAFPYRTVEFHLDGTSEPIADGLSVIEPDLDKLKAHYKAALYQTSDEMTLGMLGNPDESTQKRWLVKRALFDKFEAGNLSESDRAALAGEVKYSGMTVEDHLTVIGQKIAFQNWVTFRADGLRAEAEERLNAAVSAQDILAAIAWASTESASAVAEAQAMLAAE